MPDEKPSSPKHGEQWNRRQEKSQLPLYIALAIACLIIAYLLSHMSR